MRRSERAKRLPSRYSPTLAGLKPSSSQPSVIISKYMSKNVKTVNSVKTAAARSTLPVNEASTSTSSNTNRSCEILSKYAKPGEPTIAEIFGANPEKGNDTDNDGSQMDEIDVTGDEEPSKEPPSWIETGPLEAKGAPSQASVKMADGFGVPGMGFGDLVSQTAALPQCAFPLNNTIVIEGAAHPNNKPPPKTLAPQKRKLIQQHLILLLHAYKCEHAVSTKLPCPIPFCSVMKKVQAHMRECTDGYSCSAPFCSSSRRIMCHWKLCKTPDCVVCSRLKCIAMNKRKKELEKLKTMSQMQPQPSSAAGQSQNASTVKAPPVLPSEQGAHAPVNNIV